MHPSSNYSPTTPPTPSTHTTTSHEYIRAYFIQISPPPSYGTEQRSSIRILIGFFYLDSKTEEEAKIEIT